MTPEHRAKLVKDHAQALGFASAGITDLRRPPHADALQAWLDEGMAGSMSYMHRQASRRREPSRILPGATRAIVVTRSYNHDDPPRRPASGRIAKYARGVDYHEALRTPLDRLAGYVESVGGPETLVKWYVDHGPVPERELAQRAGLGWIGKNTMLIDPRRGSYLFLASVLTDADLAVDRPFEPDRCGSCTKCLQACPTGAFPNERVLDSRRCISYLTIEHQGEIDAAWHDGIGDWIFGCDICQDVCPWNHKFAAAAKGDSDTYGPSLADIDLQQLLNMSPEEFARRYGWTALERPGISGMQRNARIALGNLERKSLWPTSPMP